MSGGAILDWSGVLTPATDELSDAEINDRYGTLMRSAVSAFRDDPSYIVEMAESAAVIRYKRELVQARQEASRETKDKSEIKERAQEILEGKGIQPPSRTTKRPRGNRAA